jgi:hypothetical protein
MDLTRPVTYRTHPINDADFAAQGAIKGIRLDSVDYSDASGVGYTEKRSMADGDDSSDVFLSSRRVMLQGSVFGTSLADLFDRLQRLRYIFSPTSAYNEDQALLGYLPLQFEVPTLSSLWPADVDGVRRIPQELRVRPMRLPQWTLNRDRIGNEESLGQGLPFQALLLAKDPRVYAQVEVAYTSWVGQTSGTNQSLTNRGDYPSPLNILLTSNAGDIQTVLDVSGLDGSNMKLTMPAHATKPQVLRYDGRDKVVYLEVDGKTSLRMDLLSLTSGTTHPRLKPGVNTFNWTRTPSSGTGAAIRTNSRMWFWESWA